MSSEKKMASLPTIRYQALADGSDEETKKLASACQGVGMFYLDLKGSFQTLVTEDVPSIFKLSDSFFNLPSDSTEKVESLREGQERGYHEGKGFEYYEIPRNEFSQGEWKLPATFAAHQDLISRTIHFIGGIADVVTRIMGESVDLEVPESFNDTAAPSDTALKLVHKQPVHDAGAVINGAHTDFGLATFLWYDEETTQIPVYDSHGVQTDEWQTVPVVEGTFLVNVADELEKRSNGRLKSTLHRVVAPPGPKRVRNGLLYLLRPYKD